MEGTVGVEGTVGWRERLGCGRGGSDRLEREEAAGVAGHVELRDDPRGVKRQ